jgi:ppGpp synthetase/RelA/SpoT-type nucleotidyltranferase
MPSLEAENMSMVSAFLEEYSSTRDAYTKAAEAVAETCIQVLKNAGIKKSIVTSRSKVPESLRKKLKGRERHLRRRYDTMESIEQDIVDLSAFVLLVGMPKIAIAC